MMNEPHRGYIDLQSLHSFDYNTDLHLAHVREYFLSFFYIPLTNVCIQLLRSNHFSWVLVTLPRLLTGPAPSLCQPGKRPTVFLTRQVTKPGTQMAPHKVNVCGRPMASGAGIQTRMRASSYDKIISSNIH